MGDILNKTRDKLWAGTLDCLTGDPLMVVPVDSSYTPDYDNDEFLSDIVGAIGTAQTVNTVTAVNGLLAGDGVVYNDVPNADIIAKEVFYFDTGTAGTSPLLCIHDQDLSFQPLAVTSDGSNIASDWPSGIAQI